jgi:hypothetical protein
MFDLNGITINVLTILDPEAVTGAEYFNWFFTLIAVFGMLCFGINLLVKIISRS